MNESGVTNESNCSQFDVVWVSAIRAGTGFISLVLCALAISLMVLFKRYITFTQRLVLYLNISAAVDSLSIVLQRADYFHENTATRGYCVFAGFLNQYGPCVELMAICCITAKLFFETVYRLKTDRLELVYLMMIFVFPLLFDWIPFIQLSYGQAGPWCWIRKDDQDCNKFHFGVVLRFVLWYVPAYVLMLAILVTFVVILVSVGRQRHKWEGKFDPETEKVKEHTQKAVRTLIWYPFIFLLLNIFPLINRIYDIASTNPTLAFWVLHALITPLQGGFIAMVFTFDRSTLRMLSCKEMKAAFRSHFESSRVREYEITPSLTHSDSIKRQTYLETSVQQLTTDYSTMQIHVDQTHVDDRL